MPHPNQSSLSTTYMHSNMQAEDADLDDLLKTLTDNFNLLADEVQLLSDRKTILEHKLRFAHEQVRGLPFTLQLQTDTLSLLSHMMKQISSRS
jgi:hypothetical protein